MSRTVLQLRHAASGLLRDIWTGTLTAQASVGDLTLYDSKRIEADSWFANGHIHIGTDATAEDHRLVDSSAGGLTLANDGGILTARSPGVSYEIHKLASVQDYNRAIANAILSAGVEASLASKDDQTLLATANAARPGGMEDEYVIPAGFKYIWEVWVADTNGYFDLRIPNDQITILPGAVKKLRFTTWATAQMRVGQPIRLLGQALEDVPTLSDSSTVTLDPQYIINAVELEILSPIAGGSGSRAQAAMNRVRTLTQLVELRRNEAASAARVLPGSLVIPI